MNDFHTYRQSTGEWHLPSGVLLGVFYAGHGAGKNNPQAQNIADVGPLPCGDYAIGPARDDPPGGKGPCVMDLTPSPSNKMFGRSEFMIHGDKKGAAPGYASRGCVVAPPTARHAIAAHVCRLLKVVP